MPDKDEGERTIQIPGLVAGCQQPEPSFEPWEKAEKGGALKSMFFWKVKVGENLTKPATESKDNNDEKPSKDTAEKKSSKTHEESVDSTIYKILTRQRKKRLNRKKKKKKEEKEADIGEVKWRGPREQQSEVPIQRKIHSVRN